MDILEKIKFIFKKPKIVIVAGAGSVCAKEAIRQVLKGRFKKGEEIFIFDFSELKNFRFLIEKASLPILVATHVGEIPFNKDFFAGEKEATDKIVELAKIMPPQGRLILNFDDETVREIKDETNLKETTFGFGDRADFRASDIMLNSGINFKINYRGNVVPFWLEFTFGKEQIYAALSAAAAGVALGLNLVEISQALKKYHSLPGKMQLIGGIKNSRILDDSESATVFSMLEALDILAKIQNPERSEEGQGRRIAVLGDVVSVGKYAIEAHESIGEKAKKCADLLFTIGGRAKFIGEGAFEKGMPFEKIHQFDTIEQSVEKLKGEIREGDLVLVDGSSEMEMKKIVDEIKA